MTALLWVALGIVLGAAAVALLLLRGARGLVVREVESPASVEDTVARISKAAEGEGWRVLGVRKLHDSIREHAGVTVRPVHLVDLCHPGHAGKILADDAVRPVSVFMPCTISVYEKADGRTYVASTNAAVLGRAFGGVVAEVMAGPVSGAQERFVSAATSR